MKDIYNRYNVSKALLDKGLPLIPTVSQTFSKGYAYYPVGAAPLFVERGKGSHVWDVDDNEYIDFICGLGPITLGYNYPYINDAIKWQLDKGIIFSQPHPMELYLSEMITKIIPCAQMVKFSKTGSEVTSAAIKASRAYTKKNHILFRGYHGWHDWYSVTTNRPGGIPEIYASFMHEFQYNNIESVEKLVSQFKGQIAALIMEPVIVEAPNYGFLQDVRDICTLNNIVLIFDEMVTGFRWDLGGAQHYFNVYPDLATFGKGMANGMPLAMVCGKSEIMQMFNDVFFSTTFGGECLSLIAGATTIHEMQEKNTIQHCWEMGKRLRQGLAKIGVKTDGYDCRPALVLPNDQEYKSKLLQELFLRGIMIHIGGLINLCASHTVKDIDQFLSAYKEVLKVIDTVDLHGSIAYPAFKRV